MLNKGHVGFVWENGYESTFAMHLLLMRVFVSSVGLLRQKAVVSPFRDAGPVKLFTSTVVFY